MEHFQMTIDPVPKVLREVIEKLSLDDAREVYKWFLIEKDSGFEVSSFVRDFHNLDNTSKR